MTAYTAAKQVEALQLEYLREHNPEKTRSKLHELFFALFEAYSKDENFRPALLNAYSLLRKLENGSPAPLPCGLCFDTVSAAAALVLAADTLVFKSGASFSFECDCVSAFSDMDYRSFCRILSSLLANAFKYSDCENTSVRLVGCGSFVRLSVSSPGRFDCRRFQRALNSDGSLGYANRVMKSCGGSVLLLHSRNSSCVALKIPVCNADNLQLINTYDTLRLLFDRLSPLFVAFCGH